MQHCFLVLIDSCGYCAFAHFLYAAWRLGRLVLCLACLIEKEIRCSMSDRWKTHDGFRGVLYNWVLLLDASFMPSSADYGLVLCMSKRRLQPAPALFSTFQRCLVRFYLRYKLHCVSSFFAHYYNGYLGWWWLYRWVGFSCSTRVLLKSSCIVKIGYKTSVSFQHLSVELVKVAYLLF